VFLSVAGFPEDEIFDQLSSWANLIYGRTGMLVAEIYRPAAETMVNPYFKDKADDILAATAQAGREIVESMQIQPETMRRIMQVILEDEDKDLFHMMGNVFWKTCITEGVTPKEFEQKGIIPRPDSIDSFLIVLKMGFNAEAAGDTAGTIQFNFDGEVQGSCHLVIHDGNIETKKGTAKDASMTINSPFELWIDIMTGKADGQQMLMEKKYKVDGDFNLLMRMNQLFGRNN
jgi:putative sterol carrier protein